MRFIKLLICKFFGHREVECGWRYDSDSGAIYFTKCSRCKAFGFYTR
jgi:hypothetical protein